MSYLFQILHICPLSSSFLPEFDIDNHQNISQLLESFLWKINPLKQQRIQFHQISHLWPIRLNDRIIRLQPSGQTLLSCYKITANIKFLADQLDRSNYPIFSQWKLISLQHINKNPFRVKWADLSSMFWSSENFTIIQKGNSEFWKWIKQRLFCIPYCAATITDLCHIVISSKAWDKLDPNWVYT